MSFLLSALPIGLLIYWMTKRRPMPSTRALPLAALVLYVLLHVYFGIATRSIHAALIDGLLTAWTPILIVLGATLLFLTLEHTGAMSLIREWLNGITTNRVAQLMIIGWSFSFLVEGVSGFGTPAALAAPLLVGIGFPALPVAVLCLMMNSVPVSFGAVGMPTWFGLGNLGLSENELRDVAFKTAILHTGGAALIPFLALRIVLPWSEIRQNLGYILLVVGGSVAVYITVARFSVEFPAIAGGVAALLLSIGFARSGWGLAASDKVRTSNRLPIKTLLKATFPLWATVLILLGTRLQPLGLRAWLTGAEAPWTLSLGNWGEWFLSPSLVVGWRQILGTDSSWSHAVLYVPSLIPFFLVSALTFLLFRTPAADVRTAVEQSFLRIARPLGAFLGALVFVKLLMVGADSSPATILGGGLAGFAGGAWQYAAVYLGALGSFFSGSNTVANLTFGGIQDATATQLNLNRTTILSLQSVGGAMGNMVCIHNIVAVCSILGLQNQEGAILRRTVLPMVAYGAAATLISFAL